VRRSDIFIFILILVLATLCGCGQAGHGAAGGAADDEDGGSPETSKGVSAENLTHIGIEEPLVCRVEVQPALMDNPLARQIIVTTNQSCRLTAKVTSPESDGHGASRPAESRRGTWHSFWFYGLLSDTRYHYTVASAEPPGEPVAEGRFMMPDLNIWAPRPMIVGGTGEVDRRDWIAVSINAGMLEADPESPVDLFNAIAVYDRRGRIRFLHRMTGTPGYSLLPPITGLTPLPDGALVVADTDKLVSVWPDGSQAVLFEPSFTFDIFRRAHHQFFLNADEPDTALILYNRFGEGVECDLTTPTSRAVGDGVAIVTRAGEVLWEWDVFDHTDAIPPTAMRPGLCEGFHWGADTYDWTHANAVAPVPGEAAILISMRHAMRVIKVAAPSGDILWQMGPGLDFAWVGDEPPDEQWFMAQHDTQILDNGHLLMFDNNNCRGDDCFDGPWSRALELEIDEEAMTVRRVWEHRVPFSHAVGNVQRRPDGRTLICNGWQGDIVETTYDHEEVWTASFLPYHILTQARWVSAWWDYDAE
jgi:Arylsulfotransferase (ASST)